MAKFPLFTGTGVDGKKYGFRAKDSAYPQAILADLGLTKVATNGTVPNDITILPDNQIRGFFPRIRISLKSGKNLTKFCAANKAGSLKNLRGKTTNGSQVVNIRFTG